MDHSWLWRATARITIEGDVIGMPMHRGRQAHAALPVLPFPAELEGCTWIKANPTLADGHAVGFFWCARQGAPTW